MTLAVRWIVLLAGVMLVQASALGQVPGTVLGGLDTAEAAEVGPEQPTELSIPPDTLTVGPDTLTAGLDALPPDSGRSVLDSLLSDTTLTDSARKAIRDSVTTAQLAEDSDIDAPIDYGATDSMIFDLQNRQLYLFANSQVDYTDLSLTAHRIRIDWPRNRVYAEGYIEDSTGELRDAPVFQEGSDVYNAEEMVYNYATRKGQIRYVRTNQAGQILQGDTVKRLPDNVYYVKNGRFTSCDADHPHFYIQAKRIKVVPNDKIVSGRAQMFIGDVPMPLVLPFGFFPNQNERASGVILPEYGRSEALGYFFRNMGYYWAVSDYMDLRFTTDLYTKGSYLFRVGSTYRKRYGPSGRVNIEYQEIGQGGFERSDLAFSSRRTFNIGWQHDQPISPQTRFSANVNAGSAQHFEVTSPNPTEFLQNTFNSTVTYQTRLPNRPWSINLGVEHSQNTASRQLNLTLPRLAITRDRFFPLASRNSVGGRSWRDKISMTYSAQAVNRVSTFDSLLFDRESFDQWRNGLQHQVGLSANYKLLNYIIANPTFNYTEVWYAQRTNRQYVISLDTTETLLIDPTTGDTTLQRQVELNQELQDFIRQQFTAGRQFNLGVQFSTNLYGIMRPANSKRQFEMRHTLRPSIGYTYNPDFTDDRWGYFDEAVSPLTGETQRYNIFQGLAFGGPSATERQSVSFGINNVLEAKYLPKGPDGRILTADSTGKAPFKYLTIFDNLGLSSNYNFAADSFNLAPFSLVAASSLLDRTFQLNFNASLDPYTLVPITDLESDEILRYQRRPTLLADQDEFPLRLSNAQLTVNANFSNDKRHHTSWVLNDIQERYREAYLGYRRFSPTWRLTMGYTSRYTNPKLVLSNGVQGETLTHSANMSGTFGFTPNWTANFSTNYDFTNRELATTRIDINRDLHCWVFSFSWVPFGLNRSYFLTIQVKASTLQDLKVEKRRIVQDNF